VIEEFYTQLQQEINRTRHGDYLIVMGYFNAKVGANKLDDREVMGPYGMGERNKRGERLIDFCYVNNLFITNTKFKQAKMSRCWTWEDPVQCTIK